MSRISDFTRIFSLCVRDPTPSSHTGGALPHSAGVQTGARQDATGLLNPSPLVAPDAAGALLPLIGE